MKRFAGKVSLIAGGTDGIGLECARRLGVEGSAVVITGRDEQRLQKAVKKLRDLRVETVGVQGHIGSKDHREDVVQKMLNKYGKCDNFIASAACNPLNSTIMEVSDSKWDHYMNVNLKSAFHFTQLVIPSMKEQGGGSIVYISSAAGNIPGYFYEFPVYGVSKAALDAMAQMTAPELGESNIRVNSMSCGYFETKFAKLIKTDKRIYNDAVRMMCLKRPGKVEEAGGLAAYLCSEEGAWITGQVIGLHGGFRAR